MQPSFQITIRRFVLSWAGTGLVVVAVAAMIGHLIGPHTHGHVHGHVPDVAAIAGHEVDHDPLGHGADGETECGYLVQVEAGGQPAADPGTSAGTIHAARLNRDIASVGSPQDSRAPPDLMSELQVIRI